MMKFEKRFVDIILRLYEAKSFVSSSELSNALNVSTKTISREVKKYKANDFLMIHYGLSIEIKQGYGYRLDIKKRESFQLFLNDYHHEQQIMLNHYELNRDYEIIRMLLVAQDYVTIATIADKLYVSDATVSADLKNIRHLLQRYGVQMKHKSSKGVKIVGNEMNLRLCISKYLFYADHHRRDDVFEHDQEQDRVYIQQVLLRIFQIYKINMSDVGRDHFITHILISIQRIKHGKFIAFEKEEKDKIAKKKEYVITKEIVEAIQLKIPIYNEEEEIIYIAIQLLGKRTLTHDNEIHHISKDIENTLSHTFIEIDRKLGIDLTSDEQVFHYLLMHFEPMFIRLKYGIKSLNPLLDEVKTRQTTSFEMGLIAKKIVFDCYQYVLDENEVSFLAMYFSLALERMEAKKKPKRIIVVCGLGVCSSRILVFKLYQRYDKYIEEVVTLQHHELERINLNQFDGIISTINKKIESKLPTIYIDDFLSDLNDKQLDNFFLGDCQNTFHLDAFLKKEFFLCADTMQNEEEAIEYIIKHISQYIEVPDELAMNILEREQLSSTAYGNYCALPHPIKMCTDETLFVVLSLNKAMKWGKKKVKCIFLLSPSKHTPSDLKAFNEALAEFILNPDYFNKFMKTPSYEVLHDILAIIE